MKDTTQCETHQFRKTKIERKLICLTCEVIITETDAENHQHTDRLVRLIINHYFCPDCRSKTTKCDIYIPKM